jgi:uncharacterized protein (DUF1697 family)
LRDDRTMTVMVALLRGINVGGHNKLLMADLRAMVAGCGLHDVETYIQSGNVVCTADDLPETVGDRIASAIHLSAGMSVPVTVRTRDELAALANGNQFLVCDDDPAHHHLLFRLDATPVGGTALDEFAAFAPEQVAAAGRDVYLHLPDGMAASRLSTVVARRPALEGTIRNWRTVGKLLDITNAR